MAPSKPYHVRLHPDAIKTYRRLLGPVAERIESAIDGLAINPRPPGAVKLAGRDDFRTRVGDHRIVYAVDDREKLVIIARMAHRRDAYRP
ncbi:MAG TPA: type II toxin-antitoxin system RelE/ParE family toxin [Candidatus Dormibacteraeota bacterium]|nr:type II toxin-antitoxin system RelE/ParE family toxin [Candidatus Dormibacteraeota bacterium]